MFYDKTPQIISVKQQKSPSVFNKAKENKFNTLARDFGQELFHVAMR